MYSAGVYEATEARRQEFRAEAERMREVAEVGARTEGEGSESLIERARRLVGGVKPARRPVLTPTPR